jgi:antitoxin VapB
MERIRVARNALGERLGRGRAPARNRRLSEELQEIGERCAALPTQDSRTPENIVGYDERGLPR